jgi:hypothetical protein
MLILPGPGLLVLASGLAVLAAEFTWARQLLVRARTRQQALLERTRRHSSTNARATGEGGDARGPTATPDTV